MYYSIKYHEVNIQDSCNHHLNQELLEFVQTGSYPRATFPVQLPWCLLNGINILSVHFIAYLRVLPPKNAFLKSSFIYFIKKIFFVFGLFRAALVAYGGSQAGGRIGAGAASHRHSHSHSHSNEGSELYLRPTPQLTQCQILNPLSQARDWTASSCILVGFVNHWAMNGTPKIIIFEIVLLFNTFVRFFYIVSSQSLFMFFEYTIVYSIFHF